jgi:glycosyltransferase involved in cell wall biosynthesis
VYTHFLHDLEVKMPVPLFITRQSLSFKTGIGIQTRFLLEEFPAWKHLFWDGMELKNLDARSARIESALFSRIGILKREPTTLPARVLADAGLSWWNGNDLKPATKRWLRTTYKDDVSVVYVAPLSIKESERMRAILTVLEKPFVLHFWDLLNRNMADSEAFRWLVEKAAHVACLCEEMVEYIAPLRQDAHILRLTRKPSLHMATPPGSGPLRIALIGFCLPYVDGLLVLNEALRIVKQRNHNVSLIYIGNKKRVKGWGIRMEDKVNVTGFTESDDERDRLLSQCHVGFLPGPLASPAIDARSKFSIPSRVIDYMATGLPIAGTVHPESATSTYLKIFGLDGCLGVNSPELLAERLIALHDSSTWQLYSDLSRRGFLAAHQEKRSLAYWMEDAAAGVPSA